MIIVTIIIAILRTGGWKTTRFHHLLIIISVFFFFCSLLVRFFFFEPFTLEKFDNWQKKKKKKTTRKTCKRKHVFRFWLIRKLLRCFINFIFNKHISIGRLKVCLNVRFTMQWICSSINDIFFVNIYLNYELIFIGVE